MIKVPKIPQFASGSLALGGLVLMVMGIYFGFLGPPLLPEDDSYMGASLAQIPIAILGLLPWLSRVFGVFAGYMFATGLLTVYVTGTGFRAGKPGTTTFGDRQAVAAPFGCRPPRSTRSPAL